ncbi:MAG: hypothetical protein ACRC4W_02240 [Treponemataceae bacterium]
MGVKSVEEIISIINRNNSLINKYAQENISLQKELERKMFDDFIPISKAAVMCNVSKASIYDVVTHGRKNKNGKTIISNYGKNDGCRVLINIQSAREYYGLVS